MHKLLPEFITYFEKSPILILPHIKNTLIPNNIIFSNAKTLVPLFWDREAICNNLNRHHFPNINEIHYLSMNPGMDLHNRFDRVKWTFDRKPHRDFGRIHNCGNAYISTGLFDRYCELTDNYDDLGKYIKTYGTDDVKIRETFLQNQFLAYCLEMANNDNVNRLYIDEEKSYKNISGLIDELATIEKGTNYGETEVDDITLEKLFEDYGDKVPLS